MNNTIKPVKIYEYEFLNNILNLIILVLLIVFIYKNIMKKLIKIETFTEIEDERNTEIPYDTALILTTCVNPNKKFMNKGFSRNPDEEIKKDLRERSEMYQKVINSYLDRTSMDLYIIESSGSELLGEIYEDNERVFFHTFNIEQPIFFYNINNDSTTAYEAYSILQAYENFKLNRYNKILKITGRYFVPNIEEIINQIQKVPDIYIQNTVHHDQKAQRSEILGMKSQLCPGIMISIIRSKRIIEEILYDLYYQHDDNPNPPYVSQRLPKIKLEEPVTRGGDGQKIYEL